jgi:hypothetical protein
MSNGERAPYLTAAFLFVSLLALSGCATGEKMGGGIREGLSKAEVINVLATQTASNAAANMKRCVTPIA